MNKFRRFKRKLRKFLGKELLETIELEEISPSPDSIEEQTVTRVGARFAPIVTAGDPGIDINLEKKNSKKEKWSGKPSQRGKLKQKKETKETE